MRDKGEKVVIPVSGPWLLLVRTREEFDRKSHVSSTFSGERWLGSDGIWWLGAGEQLASDPRVVAVQPLHGQ